MICRRIRKDNFGIVKFSRFSVFVLSLRMILTDAEKTGAKISVLLCYIFSDIINEKDELSKDDI
jgi:hypothetical protein